LGVGVLIGCTLMEEALSWSAAIGFLAILVGVAAINQYQSFMPAWLASRLSDVRAL
jgi:hypothetical protein